MTTVGSTAAALTGLMSDVFRRVRVPTVDNANPATARQCAGELKNVSSDGEGVGWGADVAGGSVEEEVAEVDELAV